MGQSGEVAAPGRIVTFTDAAKAAPTSWCSNTTLEYCLKVSGMPGKVLLHSDR